MKKLLISTRKGLAIYDRSNGSWKFSSMHFEGIPVSITHYDPRNNRLHAYQDHGHWGVKIHSSDDFGNTWTEIEAPKFAEGAEVSEGKPASLKYVWAVENVGGRVDVKGKGGMEMHFVSRNQT